MAINKNHLFEEIDGVKCGIVEKEVPAARVEFLKNLLQVNGYTVMTMPTPAPKATPAAKAPQADSAPVAPEPPKAPETFTVGVTDYTFNPINAIFGRQLKTSDGHVVTQAYWEQRDKVSHDEIPYYEEVS